MTDAPAIIERECNWPSALYLGAMIFALVSGILATAALDGRWNNAMRGAMQALVLLVFVGRYLLAKYRREQSRAWIPYVVAMLLAAPIWMLLEPWAFKLYFFGRQFVGGQ